MPEEEKEIIVDEINMVRGKLEIVKSEKAPKTTIAVSITLPYDKKEEVADSVINLCCSLWEKYKEKFM